LIVRFHEVLESKARIKPAKLVRISAPADVITITVKHLLAEEESCAIL